MVDMNEVQLTFSLVNPDILKHKIKKTAIYSEAEAKKDETTPSKEDLNIVLVGKTMDKLSLDMKRVININTTVAGDIITSAEKILKIGTDFDKASGNKSDTLKVFEETVLTAKSFNRYIKTVEKSERTAGSVIIGAYLLATLDIAGIISEAINAISTGKYSSIDEYATSTKAYIAMIDSAKKLNGEEVSKIQSELFKESDDVSLDSLSPLAQKGMLMYSESTTYSFLNLTKSFCH
jgi:oligoendopeptidase F